MKSRKKILKAIEKQTKLNKIAQKVMQDINDANIEDPQEFADKVFDILLNNLSIEELDE